MLTNRTRAVLAISAATLLLAAGFQSLPTAPFAEEALELTTTPDAILSAIEAGATPALTGLLPTSDAYARGVAVRDGLRAAVPSQAPALSAAQLSLVTSLARGAVGGAAGSDAASALGASGNAKLGEVANGLMLGALASMPASPTTAVAASTETLARGIVEGASQAIQAGTAAAGQQTTTWAQNAALAIFDGVSPHGAQLAQIVGSPALSDVEAYVAILARGQLASFPALAADQQVRDLGAFAGGAMLGALVGIASSFPSDVPPAQDQALRAWYDGLAGGHEGVAPWDLSTDGGVDAIAAWAYGLAFGSPRVLRDAYDRLDATPTENAYLLLAAWAEGLARGGYEHLLALPGASSTFEAGLQEYAGALTTVATDYILHLPSAAQLDTTGLETYGASLVAGATELSGVAAVPPSLDAYLAELVAAIGAFPPQMGPHQLALLASFGENATLRLAPRLASIHAAAASEDDPELLLAMAGGLQVGAMDLILNDSANTSVLELGVLSSGLSTGFLESGEPQALFDDADNLGRAAQAWIAAVLPNAAVGPALQQAEQGARDPIAALQAFAIAHGDAPVRWAVGKGVGLSGEGFGAGLDVVWISALGAQTGRAIAAPLVDLDALPPSVDDEQVLAYAGALINYSTHVSDHADDANITQALDELHPSEIPGAATRFAEVVLAPSTWLTPPTYENESAAAEAAFWALVENTSTVTRFADPEYTGGVLTFLDAIGDGIASAGPTLDAAGRNLSAQAPLLEPWVNGTLAQILPVPTKRLTENVEGRAAWIAWATFGAAAAAGNATHATYNATQAYAAGVTDWVLHGEGRPPLPNATELPLPIVDWINVTIVPLLGNLPPQPAQDDVDAIVAYGMGVVTAVSGAPLPNASWTDAQAAAVMAFVGRLSADVGMLPDELDRLANETQCEQLGMCYEPPTECEQDPTLPQCQDPCETDPEAEGCDPCEQDPPGEDCEEPVPCDEMCEANALANASFNYTSKLELWAHTLVGSVLNATPSTAPTAAGIELVRLWADGVLGDNGVVVDWTTPGADWQGPRGRPYDFANASAARVDAFAKSTAAGFTAVLGLDGLNGGSSVGPEPSSVVDNLSAPMQRWLAAVQAASAGYFLDPEHQPPAPATPPAPGATAPPADLEGAGQWFGAVLSSLPDVVFGLVGSPPPETGWIVEYGFQADYLVLNAIAQGGADAVFEAQREGSNQSRILLGESELRDFAGALVAGAFESVVNASLDDAVYTAAYMEGVANGGVSAIMGAGDQLTAQQAPAIVAYAEFLANASWLTQPPTPLDEEESSNETEEEEEEEGEGAGGNETAGYDGPGAMDNFTAALEAHGAALAAELANFSLEPAASNVTGFPAYAARVLAYMGELQASGALLPPVGPDAGYTGRLYTWTRATAQGTFGATPNLSVERLGPDPNATLARAFISSFVPGSAWALVDSADDGLPQDAAWANALVAAITGASCPADATAACAAIGGLMGEAMGAGVPAGLLDGQNATSPGGNTTPSNGTKPPKGPEAPTDEQLAGMRALVNGTLTGVAASEIPLEAERAAVRDAIEGAARAVMETLPPAPEILPIVDAAIYGALQQADALEAPVVGDIAHAIATTFAEHRATLDATRAQAEAAAAYAAQQVAVGGEDEAWDAVQAFLVGSSATPSTDAPTPHVTVTSAGTKLAADDLDGAAWLSGMSANTFRVVPPAALQTGAWEIAWRAGSGAERRLALSESDGAHEAALGIAQLGALAPGSTISFVTVHRVGALETRYPVDASEAYAYRLDIERPTASMQAPGVTGSQVALRWNGADASSAPEVFHVQRREGEGAWVDLFAATPERAFTFGGEPGGSYGFRVRASDRAGHVSDWTQTVTASIPTAAAKNVAPTVAFVSPADGSAFAGGFVVQLSASDPDGTAPMLTLCLRRASDASLVRCEQQTDGRFDLDVSDLPDGRLRLVANATDGTLSSEVVGPLVTLDRAPPAFRGLTVTFDGADAVVSAAVDDAARIALDVLDAKGARVASVDLVDDGSGADARAGDDVWTAALPLGPGKYAFRATAQDALGNARSMTKEGEVPAPPAPPANGTATKPPTTTKPGGSTTTPPGGTTAGPTPTTPTLPTPTSPAQPTGLTGAQVEEDDGGFFGIPMPGIAWILLALAAVALALRRRRPA